MGLQAMKEFSINLNAFMAFRSLIQNSEGRLKEAALWGAVEAYEDARDLRAEILAGFSEGVAQQVSRLLDDILASALR